jgi:hypothetical protein
MDGAVDGFDTAVRILFGTLYSFLDRASAFDDDLAFSGVDERDDAPLAFVIAGDDLYFIAFFDVCLNAAHRNKNIEYWSRSGAVLEDLGRQGNNFHKLFFAELTSDGSEDAGSAWIVVFVDDDDRVRIEAEDRTISAADRVGGAHDDCLDDAAFFDRSGRDGIADVRGDDITNTGGACAFSEHADHFCCAGTGVIGDGKLGFHLDHGSRILGIEW